MRLYWLQRSSARQVVSDANTPIDAAIIGIIDIIEIYNSENLFQEK